ncbi:MAG: polysaccharide biosynthesis protein [Bacilli bacterium]|nr:polysaccharide biosynthesis protein [Bacilli bacterium]
MNEKKNIFFGSIISYITIFVEIIISIIFTPFLLRSLGDVDYGIRAFCVSLVGYLNLLTLGLSTSYYRFRKLQERTEADSTKRINGLFVIIFSFIALISLVVGLIFIFLIKNSFVSFNKFPPESKSTIVIILLIMVVQTTLHFPFSILTVILGYRRKFVIRNIINLINIILVPLLSTIVIIFHIYNVLLISITLVSLLVSITIDFSKAFIVFVKEKEKITFKLGRNEFKLILPIFSYCIISFVASAVSIIHNATDQIVIGAIISAEAVTFYSLSFTFSNYLETMTTSVSSLFSPKLTNDAIENKMDSVKKTCNFVWDTIAIILVFIIGGFASCGNEFVKGWIGSEKSAVYTYALLLLIVNAITSGIKVSYSVQSALNKHKFAAIVYIIFLCVNIGLSILLSPLLEIYGVIIATLFSKLLETLTLSFYSKKIIGLSLSNYWVSLIKNGVIAFTSYAILRGVFSFLDIRYLSFYVQAIIKGSLYCLIFLPCAYLANKKFVHLFLKVLNKRD